MSFRISSFLYERISLFLTTMYMYMYYMQPFTQPGQQLAAMGLIVIVMLSSKPYVIIITHWVVAAIYILKKACMHTMAVQQYGKRGRGDIRTCRGHVNRALFNTTCIILRSGCFFLFLKVFFSSFFSSSSFRLMEEHG